MQWLAKLCVRRPVFATVLMLTIAVVGMVGYTKLGLDQFPKIDFPIIVVTTRFDGAAPEEVETEITDKIEEAVNTISGIDELRSVSVEGVSQVFITFKLDKDARRRRAGGARPRQPAMPASAQGHRRAGRREARSRRLAGALRRGEVEPAGPRDHRGRRQAGAPADREHLRRRPGQPARRAQAADQRLARSGAAARRRA